MAIALRETIVVISLVMEICNKSHLGRESFFGSQFKGTQSIMVEVVATGM